MFASRLWCGLFLLLVFCSNVRGGVVVRNKQIIRHITTALSSGDMHTRDIQQYVNSNTKHGCSMNALGNILSKNPLFTKRIEREKIKSNFSGSYTVAYWGLA
jgi:hypothetical protein